MAEYIKLTPDRAGDQFWLSTAKIQSIHPEGSGSKVICTPGEYAYYVIEPPKRILESIRIAELEG